MTRSGHHCKRGRGSTILADHFGTSSGDVRDASRTRFLGGVGPIDWTAGPAGPAEGEALGRVAEEAVSITGASDCAAVVALLRARKPK